MHLPDEQSGIEEHQPVRPEHVITGIADISNQSDNGRIATRDFLYDTTAYVALVTGASCMPAVTAFKSYITAT